MIKAAIVGYGNIGRGVHEAIDACTDIALKYIVEISEIEVDIPVLKDISMLQDVDVAILSLPSRVVPSAAAKLLSKGIYTVDSFDIHTQILDVRSKLDKVAKEYNCASVTAAGWDPGTDSILRTLFLAMLPKGLTYTNFGPGMSMGHTVAAKSIKGVKDALSMTIPAGAGVHRRMVYVEIAPGAEFSCVSEAILKDDYFCHDETKVIQVESVEMLKDVGHGVSMMRKGVSGKTDNQRLEFNMSINNPALTGQILVSSARAALKQKPGCYTLIEIPPIDFLPGNRDNLIKTLV